MKKNNNNNRGVSIVETVIAMSIIITVTVTAILIVQSFSSGSSKMFEKNEILNTAENTLECFKFANDLDEFQALLGTITPRIFSNNRSENDSPNSEITYTLETPRYKLTATVVYGLSQGESDARIVMNIVDDNGLCIYDLPLYCKAVNYVEAE